MAMSSIFFIPSRFRFKKAVVRITSFEDHPELRVTRAVGFRFRDEVKYLSGDGDVGDEMSNVEAC